ncbi:Lsr2 family protein [Kibdelosporangium aridum]|uniref:Lsr2 family protein n=1 Tax=Kibdelosporangium aridum TaxID=2030 RepID=A0A428Z2A4_KIBAR|nr:histone-like nucleoid-structuring protein Lsr2 [Kibdelosporangium aridum]RSM79454.1 Lsr2 family protein [Kibdelosporangium aridum]
MAIRVRFLLIDDMDGTAAPDVHRVTFALDGTSYEIDLTAANAARLRTRLAAYVHAARQTGRSPLPVPTLADLRRWPTEPVWHYEKTA